MFTLKYDLKLENNETKEIDIDPLDVCEYFLTEQEFEELKTSEIGMTAVKHMVISFYDNGFDDFLKDDREFNNFLKCKYGYEDYFYPDEERN